MRSVEASSGEAHGRTLVSSVSCVAGGKDQGGKDTHVMSKLINTLNPVPLSLAASNASLAGLLKILAPPHFAILRDAVKGRVKFDGI